MMVLTGGLHQKLSVKPSLTDGFISKDSEITIQWKIPKNGQTLLSCFMHDINKS